VTVKQRPTQEQIQNVLTRGVEQIVKEDDLRRLLLEGNKGEPLRVKLGVDPSHYDLTIGHAVVFRKLRQFQQLGHKAVVVIGDWTARLGDPSGREEARKPLTAEQVKANAETYFEQFFRIVDPDLTEVRWQSEWFDKFDLGDATRVVLRYRFLSLCTRSCRDTILSCCVRMSSLAARTRPLTCWSGASYSLSLGNPRSRS